MAVSREKLARSVGVISDQQELVNGKKLAKPVLRKSRLAKNIVEELLPAAKPQIKAWVTRVKKPGIK